MIAYQAVGVPNLALWNQSLARAERMMGSDHPRLWMAAREIYKKAGGGEVPGLNGKIDDAAGNFRRGLKNLADRMPRGAKKGDGRPHHGTEIQLARGIEVEREHEQTLRDFAHAASDAVSAQDYSTAIDQAIEKALSAIAADHILEIPDYYDRLDRMEREAKAGKTIKLAPGSRTIDLDDGSVEALAAAADRDEKAVRAQVGVDPDVPWYADEWRP